MQIDDRITKQRIRNSLLYNWWVLLLIAGILSIASYVTYSVANSIPRDQKIYIWIGGSNSFDVSVKENLKNELEKYDIKEVSITNYYPDDQNYILQFSTIGVNNTDVYLLSKEETEEYAEAGLFSEIDLELTNNYECVIKDGKIYAIKYSENYYISINRDLYEKKDIYETIIRTILSSKFIGEDIDE